MDEKMNDEEQSCLYRFMSFQSFVDLVQSKSLIFVKPEVWDDPYEGFIFKKLRTERGRQEIQEKLPDNKVKSLFLNLATEFEKTFYAQSWTRLKESDAMWRIYAYGNFAVRIKVLESEINKIPNVNIMDIEYVAEHDIDEEIKRIDLINKRTDFKEIYRVKREAFTHEEEVRLIFMHKSAINEDSPSLTYEIDYSLVPNFIHSVCLHPQSPGWFDKTVRKYCDMNNLKYVGKSKLYEAV